jgi:hypothetical protein
LALQIVTNQSFDVVFRYTNCEVSGEPVLRRCDVAAGQGVPAAKPAVTAQVSGPVAIVAKLVVWLLVHCAVGSARLVTYHPIKVLVPIFMLSRAHLTYLRRGKRERGEETARERGRERERARERERQSERERRRGRAGEADGGRERKRRKRKRKTRRDETRPQLCWSSDC